MKCLCVGNCTLLTLLLGGFLGKQAKANVCNVCWQKKLKTKRWLVRLVVSLSVIVSKIVRFMSVRLMLALSS